MSDDWTKPPIGRVYRVDRSSINTNTMEGFIQDGQLDSVGFVTGFTFEVTGYTNLDRVKDCCVFISPQPRDDVPSIYIPWLNNQIKLGSIVETHGARAQTTPTDIVEVGCYYSVKHELVLPDTSKAAMGDEIHVLDYDSDRDYVRVTVTGSHRCHWVAIRDFKRALDRGVLELCVTCTHPQSKDVPLGPANWIKVCTKCGEEVS